MNIEKRIEAFVRLGEFFRNVSSQNSEDQLLIKYSKKISEAIRESENINPWFTKLNIYNAINSLSYMLDKNDIYDWISDYKHLIKEDKKPLKILVVMAGNIPVVGFHDFLCVLLSGNIFVGKLSSKDSLLLPLIAEVLIDIEPDFKNCIYFQKNNKIDYDAVISTGSNNTARYFEYFYKGYPKIVRKNRMGVAVLTGKESVQNLKDLADDIFMYFGLGCRNVSKLFVPENYSFENLFYAFESYNTLIKHQKYFNNYKYNKAVFNIDDIKYHDNGFALFKEDISFSTPISVVNFEYYNDINKLNTYLKFLKDKIQCIVSRDNAIENKIDFGLTQKPALSDYADGVDTMEFLLNLPA
ncbi:MAG: hypothetical protein J7J86_04615 [Bacteroidales bacterium]|nr:hypothetical protein [Bacteroidales bacterium]